MWFVFFVLAACVYAQTEVAVDSAPIKFLVEKIAKERANVTIRQKNADVNDTHTFDFSKGIAPHSDDTYYWLSVKNSRIIATNVLEELGRLDRNSTEFFHKNYEDFLAELSALDGQITAILKKRKRDRFMALAPMGGYFADEYGLKRIYKSFNPISPSAREMTNLITEGKRYKLGAVIVEPQFGAGVARVISKEFRAKVTRIAPYDANVSENLIKLAEAVAGR